MNEMGADGRFVFRVLRCVALRCEMLAMRFK